MATTSTQKMKSLRVQGSRSHNGCQACKLKRVKCDEAVPICGRCARTNRICHYEDTGAGLYVAGSKFVVYTVPKSPGPVIELPSHDSLALEHFHRRTLQQFEGPFRTELWSIIVPRLIQSDPIIRQAVMALSCLHEDFLNDHPENSRLPSRALTYYEKARQQVINLDSPDKHFDSILCACIIFAACESLRGHFETSTQHTLAAMRIIIAQRASTLYPTSMFMASKRTMDDVFLNLKSEVLKANQNACSMRCAGLTETIIDMPDQFRDAEEAAAQLQLLATQIFQLYEDAEKHYETQAWFPSQVSQVLKPAYESVRDNLSRWQSTVSRLEESMPRMNERQRAAFTLLKIFAFTYKIYLYVLVHGEDTYDDLLVTNYHVLNLIEEYLQFQPGSDGVKASGGKQKSSSPGGPGSRPLTFTPYSGVVPVLFEIASQSNDAALSQRALQILRSCNTREGVWDGRRGANLVTKLNQIRDEGRKVAAASHTGCKFVITGIQMLSEGKYLIQSGFKRIRPNSFDSWCLGTISPDEGTVESQVITI